MKFLAVLALFTATLTAPLVAADTNAPITSSGMKYAQASDVFQKGNWEAAVTGTAMFSPFGATHNRPTYDYALAIVGAGYMLTDVKEWGVARGNFEVVGEAFGGPVFKGIGSYVAGMTLWGRYNFVQPDWKLVPYAQLGAGCGFTDIDQRIIGQTFQFNLNVGLGLRYFIKPNVALLGEYRFQHISNANTGPNNLGINAQGPVVGVSWFY